MVYDRFRNASGAASYLKLSEVGLSAEELKKLSMAKLEDLEPVKEKLADAEQQLLNY